MTTIADVMSRDLLAVERTLDLIDAARQMHERKVGAVVVLDAGRLVGILTERDVLRAVATGRTELTVGESMTHAPDTVEPHERSGHAASLMIHGGFRHLPVVEGDAVVGIVSIRDLMRVHLDDESPRGA
ncbi:MAG: CBS domain-containing protein [Gaiella sp.]